MFNLTTKNNKQLNNMMEMMLNDNLISFRT